MEWFPTGRDALALRPPQGLAPSEGCFRPPKGLAPSEGCFRPPKGLAPLCKGSWQGRQALTEGLWVSCRNGLPITGDLLLYLTYNPSASHPLSTSPYTGEARGWEGSQATFSCTVPTTPPAHIRSPPPLTQGRQGAGRAHRQHPPVPYLQPLRFASAQHLPLHRGAKPRGGRGIAIKPGAKGPPRPQARPRESQGGMRPPALTARTWPPGAPPNNPGCASGWCCRPPE